MTLNHLRVFFWWVLQSRSLCLLAEQSTKLAKVPFCPPLDRTGLPATALHPLSGNGLLRIAGSLRPGRHRRVLHAGGTTPELVHPQGQGELGAEAWYRSRASNHLLQVFAEALRGGWRCRRCRCPACPGSAQGSSSGLALLVLWNRWNAAASQGLSQDLQPKPRWLPSPAPVLPLPFLAATDA